MDRVAEAIGFLLAGMIAGAWIVFMVMRLREHAIKDELASAVYDSDESGHECYWCDRCKMLTGRQGKVRGCNHFANDFRTAIEWHRVTVRATLRGK